MGMAKPDKSPSTTGPPDNVGPPIKQYKFEDPANDKWVIGLLEDAKRLSAEDSVHYRGTKVWAADPREYEPHGRVPARVLVLDVYNYDKLMTYLKDRLDGSE